MLRYNTPVEDHRDTFGLFVKREDLSCPPPGPPFSKTRGVWAHVKARPEQIIGVLDTAHSQAGHAVRRASMELGKDTVNFYPVFKKTPDAIPEPVQKSRHLGSRLIGLPAGPSWYLYHQAREWMRENLPTGSWYLMPNALKLPEMVAETAEEVRKTLDQWPFQGRIQRVIVPASSATIAAGVIEGFRRHVAPTEQPEFIIHLGYHRTPSAVAKGLSEKLGGAPLYSLVDEGYSYSDAARPGETPPWPCNRYYDLKAFRWWLNNRADLPERNTLFWNVG